MKKVLACIMIAVLLLSGCGGAASTGSAGSTEEAKGTQAEAVEESVEEAEEAAEALTKDGEAAETSVEAEEAAEALTTDDEAAETSAEAEEADEALTKDEEAAEVSAEVDESELVPEEEAKEILEGAGELQKKMGAFVSTLGIEEADEYSSGSFKEYYNDIYKFLIPSAWEEESGRFRLENNMYGAAIVMVTVLDISEYGTLDDETAERLLEMYESMSQDEWVELFGMDDVNVSDFERITFMNDQKSTVTTVVGTMDGSKVEALVMIGTDTINNRYVVANLLQTAGCEKSHFNDFKKFLGTITY